MSVPKNVCCPLHLQCVIDPIDEAVRTGAPELGLQLVFIDLAAVLICEVPNVGEGSDLPWAHDLVINKEDTGLTRLDELANLRKVAPFLHLG